MSKILIVEDETQIARFVELELRHEGYETAKAEDGRTGLQMALEQDYDLLLLDIMLPQLNGVEVLRRLRQQKNTPVIMLTARDAVMDKVSGLDAGANDYITKPFAIEELLARVRACLRQRAADSNAADTAKGNRCAVRIPVADAEKFRMSGAKPLQSAGREGAVGAAGSTGVSSAEASDEAAQLYCEVVLDADRHEVTAGGVSVQLTSHEFDLLHTLLLNKNIVLDRAKLISAVCGYDYLGETNVIDVYVRYLRAKIDERFGIHVIQTVRGVGYVIREAGDI